MRSIRPRRRSARASTSRARRRSVELKDKEITLWADSDFQLGQVMDVLLAKLTKRNVDVRFLDRSAKIEKIGGDKVKQAARRQERHRQRHGEEDPDARQAEQAQGPGGDPGRHGARHRREARRPAGGDRADPQGGRRCAAHVHQLPRLSRCARVAASAVRLLLRGSAPRARRRSSLGGSLGDKALLVIDGRRAASRSARPCRACASSASTAARRSSRSRASASRSRSAARRSTSAARASAGAGAQIVLTADERRPLLHRRHDQRQGGALPRRHRRHQRRRWARAKPTGSASTTARRARLQRRPPTARSRLPRVARPRCASATSGLQRRRDRAAGADDATSCSATAS